MVDVLIFFDVTALWGGERRAQGGKNKVGPKKSDGILELIYRKRLAIAILAGGVV
jgi:hypothetical protein